MEKLTFKQYLNSKQQLREAVKQSPVHIAEYLMRKYCKLPVGESKEEKEYIALKPKHKVIVEWDYKDVDNPDLLSIFFEDVDGVDAGNEYQSYWSNERFKKWLLRNTREV
jgi:hypothetical protein